MFVILRSLPGQRRIPYLPRERVLELRDERARAIARYAAETVPFYRDAFRREGLDPREIRSADDLERLPLIDRAVVQASPERFHAESAAGQNAVPFSTSGSSGMRLTVFHDRDALLADVGHSERERVVAVKFTGKRLRYVSVAIGHRTATGRSVQAFYRQASFRPFRPKRHEIPMEYSLERVVEEINGVQPDIVGGFGSYVELLFKTVALKGLELHRPRLVMYGGDMMSPAGRQFIEERFGLPVISIYNAVEAFKVGFFCEERRGFHLHEDLCHVRVANGADAESGELVVSNLVNRGTVLLNYRIGDVARLAPPGCECGRTSRLLSELQGRVQEIIRLRDGAVFHPFYISPFTPEWVGITRYQLVQHEPDRFELKLAAPSRAAFDSIAPLAASQVAELLHGAAVEPTYHEALDPGPRGKFSPVVALPSEAA